MAKDVKDHEEGKFCEHTAAFKRITRSRFPTIGAVGGRQPTFRAAYPAPSRPSGPLGRYDGLILILIGLALIVVAAARFMRTGRMIDDQEVHSASSVCAELILSAALALIVAALSAYVALS